MNSLKSKGPVEDLPMDQDQELREPTEAPDTLDPLVEHVLSVATAARPPHDIDQMIADAPEVELPVSAVFEAQQRAARSAYTALLRSAAVPYEGQCLGGWLAKVRQKQGLSVQEVASLFDIAETCWLGLETDPGVLLRLSPDVVADILDVFNVPLVKAFTVLCDADSDGSTDAWFEFDGKRVFVSVCMKTVEAELPCAYGRIVRAVPQVDAELDPVKVIEHLFREVASRLRQERPDLVDASWR